ncbi:MAG: HAD family phosphatase [Actinobacteria bacterium]|nr:MAG: HAD family phosphatase [Actinomycetota bacterium]
MSTRPRAIAFDFNGTLSDDEQIMCAIYEQLFAEHGRPMSQDDYYAALAGNTEEAIIGGWLGVTGKELAALVAERIKRYQEAVAGGSTVTPELRESVRYAAARVPVAVVSGAFREEIEPVLDAAGLDGLFAFLVTADDVVRGKPDPECYERLVRILGDGMVPADVVVFEDTEAGVASAKGAGVRCIAVRGTLPSDRLSRADEIVDLIDVGLMQRLLG